MIEVEHFESDAEIAAEFVEKKQQRGGIRTAGYGHTYHIAGTKHRVAAGGA
jgi:hypothetical protein